MVSRFSPRLRYVVLAVVLAASLAVSTLALLAARRADQRAAGSGMVAASLSRDLRSEQSARAMAATRLNDLQTEAATRLSDLQQEVSALSEVRAQTPPAATAATGPTVDLGPLTSRLNQDETDLANLRADLATLAQGMSALHSYLQATGPTVAQCISQAATSGCVPVP